MIISGTIKRTTEKAVLIAALVYCPVKGGMEIDIWFPKSQVSETREDSLQVSPWIASKKEEEFSFAEHSRSFL